MIFSVDSPHDERLDPFRWRDRQLASKLDRQESVGAGLFVAEGDLVVQRALDSGCTPQALLCDEAMGEHFSITLPNVDIYIASEEFRREITGLGVPLRATGLFNRPPLRDPHELVAQAQRIVVAEAVDNPTNLGAITRSAVALGWDALILCAGSADPLARRALRVSMGTGLLLPFARLTDNDSLHELFRSHGCASFALTPHSGATDLAEITVSDQQKVALMFGSERDGLTVNSMNNADHLVRIPMYSGVDSLNVGAAAAIALYHLR